MSAQCIQHYPRFATILADCPFTHKSNIWCLPDWNILFNKLSIYYNYLLEESRLSSLVYGWPTVEKNTVIFILPGKMHW